MGDSVYINGRSAMHSGSAGKSMAAMPDVCLCPPTPPAGPVPTPLPNNALASDLTDGVSSVLIEGNPAGNKSSSISKSTGNETSKPTGGGVTSHATQGAAHFTSSSSDVKIGGEAAVRHLEQMTHNHSNPANTPPWPVLAKMSKAVINACSTSAEHCQLVPYSEGCPDNKTPHHVVPASCFIKSGLRGLNMAKAVFKGAAVTKADIDNTCIPGAENYRANDAPCVCVSGEDKADAGPTGNLLDHGLIHQRMDLSEGLAAKAGGWTLGDAQSSGAKSVSEVVPGCTQDCIAAQLAEYHEKKCKMKKDTPLRAHTRSEGWMSKTQKAIASQTNITAPAGIP